MHHSVVRPGPRLGRTRSWRLLGTRFVRGTMRRRCGARVLVWVALGGAACREATAPAMAPPYLAIVTRVVAPSPAGIGARYTYRVREASGTLGIDTVVVAAPTDTVILSVPPATYFVELSGVPPVCKTRDAGRAAVVVPPNTNTSIVRYFVTCQAQLTVTMATEGDSAAVDSLYAYHLRTSDGAEHLGLLRGRDTLVFFHLPEGPATLDLGGLAANCDVTSDGGESPRFVVDSAGGIELDLRVVCSKPDRRPRLEWTRASYHDGVGGLVFHAADPDWDMVGFSWDLTDCHRASLLPGGRRVRDRLQSGRTQNRDTVTVLSAFEIGLPDSLARGACAAVWVFDYQGNISPIVEVPLDAGDGSPPVATSFNARFLGPQLLRTDLTAADPDGDFLGVFAAALLRDGAKGPPDGVPDLGYYNTAGFLGAQLPDVALGGGNLTFDNYFAVIVYLFDARGNFTRLEDADLFH